MGDGRRTTLLFAAWDAEHGQELWRSNGTAAGTVFVEDINPGPADSRIQPSSDLSEGDRETLTTAGGMAFFMADDGLNGLEPWRSDGTAAGTAVVADINPRAANSQPEEMMVAGGRLFFVATQPATGRELWALASVVDPIFADGFE